MKVEKFKYITLLFITLVVLLQMFTMSCTRNQGAKKTTVEKPRAAVSIALDWTLNTNHIGIVLAKENLYFAARNIFVEILPTSEVTVEGLVGTGKADFGISFQESVNFARSSSTPLPIVAVAAILPYNTSGFLSYKDRGIESPKDFAGKRYGAFNGPMEAPTLDAIMGPQYSSKDLIFIQGAQLDFFLASEEHIYDFAWVYEGWELAEAKLRGIEYNYIPLREIDITFDYYTPVLITSESYISQNGKVVLDFVQALKEGYNWAGKNPKKAAKILYNYMPEANEKLLQASLQTLASKFANQNWGHMEKIVWERYNKWLQSQGKVDKKFSIEGAFTNLFLGEK